MKNLEIWDVSVRNIGINQKEKFRVCYNYDAENKIKLFAITHNLQVVNIDEFGVSIWSKDIAEIARSENNPINITYVSLSNNLCVALGNGELITINEAGTDSELVGIFENGLLAMEWSPDQDLLVLVSKDLKMTTMSCTFDPISEVELMDQDFGNKQFITVGWGKKETQFHGSVGKQAAKVNTNINLEEYITTDTSVKITWRGDGNFFAVSFQMDGMRRFKVFDREGCLQYTSEKLVGLESNLIWRPSGNLIATTQKNNDKYVVAFFEKNGLKHGEFAIPVNGSTIVEDLYWSSDSEILTLQCKDLESNEQRLLLFTTSNYHWYQKQILVFGEMEKINQVVWDNNFEPSSNKKLHVFLQNGKLYSYTWIWGVNHSCGRTSQDSAVVAVIDGKKLLLTSFRQTIVPPPMASLELELESDVHSIQFAPPHLRSGQSFDTNAFFVTTNKKLIFFKQIQKFPLKYEIEKSWEIEMFHYPFQYYNWCWLNDETIVTVQIDETNTYHLVEYNIANDIFSQKHTITLPAAPVKLQCHPSDPSILFLHLISGDIIQYTSGKGFITQDILFNIACLKFDVVPIKNRLHFLGLSHKGNLYVNGVLALNNVSSYFVHSSFLLITTLKHFLLCIELTESGIDSITDYQKNESPQVYKRKIERGAKIIITVPNETNTVFQMPRGNLETIQPRPLSLKIIGEFLDTLEYKKAFDFMRKQRINLNLIHDHNPTLFLKNIDKFLNSINNNSWLCLFLSDLENSDVTRTMYSSSYTETSMFGKNTSKVNEICNVIQAHINNSKDRNDKILPLLTTYIKKNKIDDLENALLLIKQLKSEEIRGLKLPVGSDEAVRFLLYMVNVDELFNVALGMYDFDLVLLVANKSQKDPKEYIPMLNELNAMEENYKKFTINKHLKRFDKAVKYLAKCGPPKYDELQAFVKYHSLYREALALFNVVENIYQQISDDFGLYLRLKKAFTEAGIIYEKAKNYVKAIECFKDALEWELALNISHHLSPEEHDSLCCELVGALKEEKRHTEALIVLEQYLKNKEETIKYTIENGLYKTAIKLCSNQNNQDVIDKKLLPAVLEEYKSLQELIENNVNEFIKYKSRLSEVREKKIDKINNIYDNFNTNRDDDLYSDTGSTIASSSGSGRSYRSSKNRRKHQRKMASLKEGSQYEDVALVMTLYNLVTSSFNLRLQVKNVNIALKYLNKDQEANKLQKNLEMLLNSMKESFKEIWTHDLVIQASKAAKDAENIPEGSNIIADSLAFLEPHIRIAPIIQDIHWKLEELS